ncbi:MAG: ABC transporter permease subunit [Plesiomonas shigelloides]
MMEKWSLTIQQWLQGNTIFTPETLLHYWDGFVTTVQLLIVSVWVGLLLAIPLAIIRCSRSRIASSLVWMFTYLFRGTPLLVQL